MIIIHLPWLALLYLLSESFRSSSCTDQSSLDVIPQALPDHWTPSTQYRKYIPRLIWIAVKDREYVICMHARLAVVELQHSLL